ncbi:hypothetical protein [Streptomyces guryensis]|uniref:D-alanyl-D-alanine carboxypeptidase n=1 Tax=Streptomyces guryensis TaxID=2886947 RepID=A0A9Q3VSM5_9ACTN|nr:hypothetical protein [Streptomyces guryensis]MCD9877052.1 hypothetical protein [Streptomyces guryensis]
MEYIRHYAYGNRGTANKLGWWYLIGSSDSGFVDYCDNHGMSIKGSFTDPFTGYQLGSEHMMATANAHPLTNQPDNEKSANGGDVGGWAGDLMTFWADWRNSEQQYADPLKFAHDKLGVPGVASSFRRHLLGRRHCDAHQREWCGYGCGRHGQGRRAPRLEGQEVPQRLACPRAGPQPPNRGQQPEGAPGGGRASVILLHVARRFHSEIDSLRAGDAHGWTAHVYVTESYESNNSSGSALAIRPFCYPSGSTGNFCPNELVVVRDILSELDGTVAWGGDFKAPKESHFELTLRPGHPRLKGVARKIQGWQTGPGNHGAGATDAFDPRRRKAARAFERRMAS